MWTRSLPRPDGKTAVRALMTRGRARIWLVPPSLSSIECPDSGMSFVVKRPSSDKAGKNSCPSSCSYGGTMLPYKPPLEV